MGKPVQGAIYHVCRLEAILKPIKRQVEPLAKKESYTKEINKCIPSSFCVNSQFAYGEVENPLKLYRGEDCVETFCDYVENEAKNSAICFLKNRWSL